MIAQNGTFDKLFEQPVRAEAEAIGYMAYYIGLPRPSDPVQAAGWDEAKGVNQFVRALCEEADNG